MESSRVGIDMDGGDDVEGVAAVDRIASGVRSFLEDGRNTNVVLYGDEDRIESAFGGAVPAEVEVVPSSAFYKDEPLAKYLRGTSLSNLVKDVRGGNIEGIFTIGDTAKFAAESVRMRVKGLGMPTIVTAFPSLNGEFVCSDGGLTNAHSDEKFYVDAVSRWAGDIYKQALMASVYAEGFCKGKLRWGVLSNGAENHKGSDVDRKLVDLVRRGINEKGLGSFVNYIGKVEPKDCYDGNVDVALVGGYVGNLFLKTSEASLRVLKELVKREVEALSSIDKVRLAPGKGVLDRIKGNLMAKVGAESRNCAVVLGYRVPVVKGHGEADPDSIYYGIRRLADCDERVSGERILSRVGKYFLDSK